MRLLHIDPCGGEITDTEVSALPRLLRPGDLVVVNDAATLPASLVARGGEPLEVRLAGELGEGLFRAVLFGAGDWRTPTEHRPPPPRLEPGTRLRFGAGPGPPPGDDLEAVIVDVSSVSPRLVILRFTANGAPLVTRIYAHGRPVQYSHRREPLQLWDVQTRYSARPWAVEAPSAGLPLETATLLGLRRAGVTLATLTHAAGLSSTGDPAIDAILPLPERYDIPAATVAAVDDARRRGARVVAVGTTVVRALEGAARAPGGLAAGPGTTDLHVGPDFRPRVVDGLLTGIHEPGSSHLRLLGAFVPPPLLDHAYSHAAIVGYRNHENGDISLVLCS